MKKRILFSVISMLLLTLAFTACGSAKSKTPTKPAEAAGCRGQGNRRPVQVIPDG